MTCSALSDDGRFRVSFHPPGYVGGIADLVDVDGNDVPDLVDEVFAGLDEASQAYVGTPQPSPSQECDPAFAFNMVPPDEVPIRVNLWKFDVPFRDDPSGFAPMDSLSDAADIWMDPSASDLRYLAAHELFHVHQWMYASTLDYTERQGVSMWLEATAEWAAHQATGDVDYSSNLSEFLGEPEMALEHGSAYDSDPREYGAFLFAEYLEQHYGCDVIRQTWAALGAPTGIGAIEAIDQVLGQWESGGVEDVMADFWADSYRMTATYTDPHASPIPFEHSWLDRLLTNTRTDSVDSPTDPNDPLEFADSTPRPYHQSHVLRGGGGIMGATEVSPGGAAFVDLVHDTGRSGTMLVQLGNYQPMPPYSGVPDVLTSDDVHVRILSYDSYPDLCQAPIDVPLVNGFALQQVPLSPDCRFSTLVITNYRPIDGSLKRQGFVVSYDSAIKPGDVFVGAPGGRVMVFDPSGVPVTNLYAGTGSEIGGLAFDASRNLYATHFDTAAVSKFTESGLLTGTWGTGYQGGPEGIIFMPNGNALVGHAEGTDDVQKRSPSGALLASFDVTIEDRGSDWLALKPDDCTLLYTSEGARILRYDICTGTQLSDFATSASTPAFGIQLLPNGDVLVAATSAIRRYNSAGSLLSVTSVPGALRLFGLALSPDGSSYWVTDIGTAHVYQIDLATGAVLKDINTFSVAAVGDDPSNGIAIMPVGGGAGANSAGGVPDPIFWPPPLEDVSTDTSAGPSGQTI